MAELFEALKEGIAASWESWSWYYSNAIVATMLFSFVVVAWRLSKRPYWRLAARETMKRRIAVVSFGILCVYVTIALLDSIGHYKPVLDRNGEPIIANDGKPVEIGESILDYLLTPLREAKETTYSSPFADKQFTSEITLLESGVPAQIHPALKHPGRHFLGTDKTGEDVLYQAFKAIRTGMILGLLTTAIVVPFAIFFGVVAGYFGGWVDDAIQYLYTVLSSIPSVLLIAAFVLIFGRGLMQLCIIMGITSWTGLCRVLRGETLKLREMEYVQSAEAMGVSRWTIIQRHLVPNVMHVVLITVVLGFSNRVLAEAVLTYIGIGVGADTYSWGRMINDARLELARDPMIWWRLVAAFTFMMGLVLPANIFGDALRDALDPRLRTE